MFSLNNYDADLFASACTTEGLFSEEEIVEWVTLRIRSNKYSVHITPLDELERWFFDGLTGNISHSSGFFFRVEGLDVEIRDRISVRHWQQPIINQPEIGILGFIAKNINGILHLLVQAKMEPGNINLIQISPTVQATRSNYTQVHGGSQPAFINYFIGRRIGKVLVDQLQSEQGARYLRKRNRNIIIRVPDDHLVEYNCNYKWVTIGQLQRLMRFANLVHLDCRSIIGSLYYGYRSGQRYPYSANVRDSFSARLRESTCADYTDSASEMPDLLSWLTNLKSQYEVTSRSIPLRSVASWSFSEGRICHESGCFFSVIGVEVSASNREVPGWCQPLIQSIEGGVIGLVSQSQRGVLHFLIQGLVEPGQIDIVELAPTVQCTPLNYLNGAKLPLPPFIELFELNSNIAVRFDSILSDEGGRFYHSKQRYVVVELDENARFDLPDHYTWMTLAQIQDFARFSNLVNIELRSILSCLALVEN